MGALFRSEEMELVQIFIQPEAAYESVSKLGEQGMAQFRDLNGEVSMHQRRFVTEVRRSDEMARKLRYIKDQMAIAGIKYKEVDVMPTAPKHDEIPELEAKIDAIFKEIIEVINNSVTLKTNANELTSLKHVLESTKTFFEGTKGLEPLTSKKLALDPREKLEFVAGLVRTQRVPAFERMLWRVSRGNVYLRTNDTPIEVENPRTGVKKFMTSFVAFYQGDQLKVRVHKICAGFHAKLYPCPATQDKQADNLQQVAERIDDIKAVLERSKEHTHEVLSSARDDVAAWHVKVKKMKAIYHVLNLFAVDHTNNYLIGECWIPVRDIPLVQSALQKASTESGSQMECVINKVPTDETPPTFNRNNKFTAGFQALIDAYGVANYREVNPALYTIVTFPFLFAVMFGDFGHGFIMMLFGLWMVKNEVKLKKKRSTNEIWNIFFGGRYIILMMGIFSIYTGIIYNDIFSKAINIFGSSWKNMYKTGTLRDNKLLTVNPNKSYTGKPYYIGMDPVWNLAGNRIIFLNSYKMKLSIIIGVIHMIFGVCLSVVNYRYFKTPIYTFLIFLPQIIILTSLFGYLVFMMIYKWFVYSGKTKDFKKSQACAPSVLILFINMMLFTKNTAPANCDANLFPFQQYVNYAIVAIAFLAIPVLLLGRPMYVLYDRRKKEKRRLQDERMGRSSTLTTKKESRPAPSVIILSESKVQMVEQEEEHEEPFSEVMIHQGIETIEYVLSTISHTASYLRLWALSLAHAELAEVVWSMVLRAGLTGKYGVFNSIILFFSFSFWAMLSMAILVLMEGLSAFLHTLRLHWVEFMSKFYLGLGYAFMPFSFKNIESMQVDEEEEKEIAAMRDSPPVAT